MYQVSLKILDRMEMELIFVRKKKKRWGKKRKRIEEERLGISRFIRDIDDNVKRIEKKKGKRKRKESSLVW